MSLSSEQAVCLGMVAAFGGMVVKSLSVEMAKSMNKWGALGIVWCCGVVIVFGMAKAIGVCDCEAWCSHEPKALLLAVGSATAGVVVGWIRINSLAR